MNTTENVLAARVLDEAANQIEQRGWTKGQFEAASGAVCLMGAVEAGADLLGADLEVAADLLTASLSTDLGGAAKREWGYVSVARVNDHILHRKREAISVLRRAARRARGQAVRPLRKVR